MEKRVIHIKLESEVGMPSYLLPAIGEELEGLIGREYDPKELKKTMKDSVKKYCESLGLNDAHYYLFENENICTCQMQVLQGYMKYAVELG